MTFDRESKVTKTYQVWSHLHPMELVEATSSFEARKAFAAKHCLLVSDCMARRLDLGEVKPPSASVTFDMKPKQTAGLDTEVGAAWTIHVDDGFETQIGTRLERRRKASGATFFRMVFKDDKNIEVDTEREALILIQGILLGRCLC